MCQLLDHLFFPHILDSIVAFSDVPTRLALRRACRCMRDQVDLLDAVHVVLEPDGATAPDGARVPALSPWSSPAAPGTDARTIRLLDVRCNPEPYLLALLERTSLHVVRVLGDYTVDFRCDTLVLHSLHCVPSSTRARTVVLDVSVAPGLTHLVTAPQGSIRTLVVPKDSDIVVLGNPRVARVDLDEWRASDEGRALRSLECRAGVD